MPDDWRLEHLRTQSYLRGVRFHFAKWHSDNPRWDHDHCAACWVRFMERGSELEPIQMEGYTTGEDYKHGSNYEWVCRTCFADFKNAMGWIEE